MHRSSDLYISFPCVSVEGVSHSRLYSFRIYNNVSKFTKFSTIRNANDNSMYQALVRIEEDNSCDGMYDCFQIFNKELNEAILSGEITVNIYRIHNGYEPYLRIFYLMNLCDNPHYNFTDENLYHICQSVYLTDQCWFYDDYLAMYESYEKIA